MSEVRRALKALQQMIAKVGIENVPLGNVALRPLLVALHDISLRRGSALIVFERNERIANKQQHDQLMLGLMAQPGQLPIYRKEIGQLFAINQQMRALVTANGRKLMVDPVGPGVLIWHQDLWLPAEVLLLQRN